MSDPITAAKSRHRQLMVAHQARLETFSVDAQRWITQMETAHREFYQMAMQSLEQTGDESMLEAYEHYDLQCIKRLAALQAASERLIEAAAHIGVSLAITDKG